MKFFLLAILSAFCISEAKVLFITHSFNRPDFLEIQVKTFNALLEDEYELVVFNDASDANMERTINATCSKLGLRCFRVPQELHLKPGRQSAGHRHIDGIQFALTTIGYDHNDMVVLIDSDMFLIKPFSIAEYMNGIDLAGDLQGRAGNGHIVRYLSPALAFMNMKTLPDKRTLSFEGGYIHGLACDVGAHTYYYMQNHPEIKTRFYNQLHIGAWKITAIQCTVCNNMTCDNCTKLMVTQGFDENAIRFIQECPDDIEFNMNGHFLHYRCGSNWNNKPQSYIQAKTNALNNLALAITRGSL